MRGFKQEITVLAQWSLSRLRHAFCWDCEPRMRMTVVPQTEHWPLRAGLPFFIVTACAFCISRFVLHFTQYAVSIIVRSTSFRS